MNHYALNLTKKCQNNCLFCAFKNPPVLGYEFNSVNYKKFLNDAEIKGSIISLGGGEPTLNDDLSQIIIIFKKRDNYVELITNGQKLSDFSYCKEIIESGIDRFCVSLHSIDKNNHNFLTTNNDSFKKTFSGILNLIKLRAHYKYDLNIVYVLNRYNLKDLGKTLSFLNRLGDLNVQINLAHTSRQELLLDLNDIMKVFSSLKLSRFKNLKFHLYGFAFCFLPPQWRNFIVDFKNDDKIIVFKGKEYNHLKLVEIAKIKFSICNSCDYNSKCYGIWRAYIINKKNKNLNPIYEIK